MPTQAIKPLLPVFSGAAVPEELSVTCDGLVWSCTVDSSEQIKDGRYLAELQRRDGASGELTLFDREDSYRLVHHEPVICTFGAAVGPDWEDVADWQGRILRALESTRA